MKIESNLEIPDFLLILKNLENVEHKTTMKIHQETKITYAHVHKIQKMLEKKGLVKVEKRKQEKSQYNVVSLTDNGHKLVAYLNEILSILEISELQLLTLQNERKKSWKKKTEEKKDGANSTHGDNNRLSTQTGTLQGEVLSDTRTHLEN